MIRAVIHGAHAHELDVDVRFGVDQELSRGHDALSLSESREHFDARALYPADTYGPASEAFLGELHHNSVRRFAGAADQRRCGYREWTSV